MKVGVSVARQNRHDLETLFQITKEQDLELEPDTYMMSTESGQHEARLSPEEAAAASLAATRIKLGTVGFYEYAQRTVQALESAVPETEAGMRCLAGRVFVCRRLARRFAPVRDARGAFRADRNTTTCRPLGVRCGRNLRRLNRMKRASCASCVRCAARVRHRLCARAARSARCRLMYAPTQKRSTACCARKAQRPKF